jgi:OmpR family response regulator RpaB
VLLAVDLPHPGGLTVCRALRQESTVPILLLVARGQEQEQVRGLELGADGCLVKPFGPSPGSGRRFRELLARVQALLRRRALIKGNGLAPADRIAVGDIVLDRATCRVWRAGRPVHLRRREFDKLRATPAVRADGGNRPLGFWKP